MAACARIIVSDNGDCIVRKGPHLRDRRHHRHASLDLT